MRFWNESTGDTEPALWLHKIASPIGRLRLSFVLIETFKGERTVTPEHLILVRLMQLTLGALIGCLCIYFGYKLFSQLPVNVTNDGHFKMPKFGEAKFKVAPGIFFALFGTAIVLVSINRSISITTGAKPDSGSVTSYGCRLDWSGISDTCEVKK